MARWITGAEAFSKTFGSFLNIFSNYIEAFVGVTFLPSMPSRPGAPERPLSPLTPGIPGSPGGPGGQPLHKSFKMRQKALIINHLVMLPDSQDCMYRGICKDGDS